MRTITGAEHADMLAIRDDLRKGLLRDADERHIREEMVDGPDGPEPDWMRYERHRMLTRVNNERVHRGLQLVDVAAVWTVEQQAAGHVDYADKFTLYCAELAIGVER